MGVIMAEGQFLFALDYTEFFEAWSQKDLPKLQQKFDTSPVNLSQSLLISEETEGTYWLLADFENRKAYNIRKENDTTVEVSEGPDMEKHPDILGNAGTILPRLKNGIGTHVGIIDALKKTNFNIDNLEELKRSDLSVRGLSFESVYPDLEVTYKLLVEILASSRDTLVSLSFSHVQQLQNYVLQPYEIDRKILDFRIETKDENIRLQHDGLLQEIRGFCDGVKNSLLQVAAYLSSRTAEQLKDEFKSTVTDAEEKLNRAISEEVDKLQKIGEGINEQQTEVLQKSEEKLKEIEQTHNRYLNRLTKIPLAEYKIIFEDQAKKHEQIASYWLWATVGLTVLFGGIFVWLFLWLLMNAIPTEVNISVVLSNLFTKGFFLSLVFLLLNRSIKNYTAEKHLEIINTHRKNALATFEVFADSAGASDTREQVLLAATKTIFDANQSGYLSTKISSSDSASPVHHFIKEVLPSKPSTDSE